MTVFRLDRAGTVSRVEPLQVGFRVDAALTKGDAVFVYQFAGKTVRELRPLEEVERADSLATLRDAPVTNNHPPGTVSPKNFKKYAVGHVSGEARMDGVHVVGSLAVQEESMLQAIKAGQREVSCGYNCRIEETSGVTAAGEPYDRIQRDITYNHVAIVPRGRAGRDVALRLDSAGNEEVDTVDPTPEEKLAAVTGQIEKLRESLAQQLKWHEESKMEATARIAELENLKSQLETKLKEATARADKAEGELVAEKSNAAAQTTRADAAESKVKEIEGKARLESTVAEARKVLGQEFKADGLDELAIMRQVVGKAFPNVDVKAASLEFVNPLFVAATSKPVEASRADADKSSLAKKSADLRRAARQTPKVEAKPEPRKDSEVADWQKPLALSK